MKNFWFVITIFGFVLSSLLSCSDNVRNDTGQILSRQIVSDQLLVSSFNSMENPLFHSVNTSLANSLDQTILIENNRNSSSRSFPIIPVENKSSSPNQSSTSIDNKHAVTKASNLFALDLYNNLQHTEDNLLFSPWSTFTALGMTYAGAKGDTAKEMANTLYFKKVPSQQLHQTIGSIQKHLTNQDDYQLAIANRIYPYQGLVMQEKFTNLLNSAYGATIQLLDYRKQTDKSRQTINAWVKQQTLGKIPQLLQKRDIDSNIRMVLVNAIYFKAKWTNAFKPQRTKPLDFYVTPTNVITTPMMTQDAAFKYGDNLEVQVLELPYVGNRITMLILLPKKRDGLTVLEKQLTLSKLNKLISSLQPERVKVYLPRFKLSSRFYLKPQLVKMGMPTAFDEAKADFSDMVDTNHADGLAISNVIHQANCDVTEEGTVATAATAVTKTRGTISFGGGSSLPEFRADHPFMFLIRDTQTDAILFLGKLVQPKKIL